MAFADDHKQLTLWEWQDNAGLKFVKQWNLVRRANKITFDKNDQNILVAGMYTVWKFHTFAITQILREINFTYFILEVQNLHFSTSRFSKIDFM